MGAVTRLLRSDGRCAMRFGRCATAVLNSRVVMVLIDILRSPIGPSLTLTCGALLVALFGRWLRRPALLTGLALVFVAIAGMIWVDLRFQQVVPVFSRSWQPLFQAGANLEWLGDGWNWYVTGLMLLLGGLGILLDMADDERTAYQQRIGLAVNMAIAAAAVLFVSSGNLLTVVFTWVLLDIAILVRGVARPGVLPTTGETERWYSQTRGLSLLGAVLLMIALLPAGPTGPSQPLQGGTLPYETLMLLMAAALLRTGIYPLHFWLLPDKGEAINIAERLLDHVAPVLSGMWLVGWVISLGGASILQSAELATFLTFSMLIAAFAAFVTRDTVSHTTFVFVAAAGQCLLAAALFYNHTNPAAMLWPATTFVLGGSLWLVGRQIWQGWGWQLPVSVGALALAGAPFTPGFLMQPSFASLLGGGALSSFYFFIYVVAQGFLVAALLRSWGQGEQPSMQLSPTSVLRLLVGAVALAIPLALAGFLPGVLSAIANIPGAIPPQLGSPPSVVAELPVWIPLLVSLGIGMALVYVSPHIPARVQAALGRLGSLLRLDWFYQGTSWSLGQLSSRWGAGFSVIEGAGYMGWMLAFVLLAYLLIA